MNYENNFIDCEITFTDIQGFEKIFISAIVITIKRIIDIRKNLMFIFFLFIV